MIVKTSIDFPLKNVIYVSNCVNGQAVYEDYCHRKNITPEINVEYIPTCRKSNEQKKLCLHTDSEQWDVNREV